jgi:hypothetical protein
MIIDKNYILARLGSLVDNSQSSNEKSIKSTANIKNFFPPRGGGGGY